MKYEVKGGSFPVVECRLEDGEKMITESGSMVWMSPNMQMETTGGGMGKMFSKVLSGENMFQNCVFKIDVDTKQWIKAAAVRAVKTMAQTFVATIGTAAVMGDVNWQMVASASALAGILSVATSIAGIPEVKAE